VNPEGEKGKAASNLSSQADDVLQLATIDGYIF